MAATIARATGEDNNRIKTAHKLGSRCSYAEAATWCTKAVAYISRDGSGYVEVGEMNGKTFHRFDFGPESERN